MIIEKLREKSLELCNAILLDNENFDDALSIGMCEAAKLMYADLIEFMDTQPDGWHDLSDIPGYGEVWLLINHKHKGGRYLEVRKAKCGPDHVWRIDTEHINLSFYEIFAWKEKESTPAIPARFQKVTG